MRSFAIVLSLAVPALLATAAASPSTSGGSLEALLQRVSNQTARALPVNAIPEDLKARAAEPEVEKREESEPAGSVRMVKRTKSWAKRWVWGTSIIQDDSPTSGLPPAGVNTDEFSDPIDVATPTVTLVAPTFPALTTVASLNPKFPLVPDSGFLAVDSSVEVVTPSAAATTSLSPALEARKSNAERRISHASVAAAKAAAKTAGANVVKKWVWGTSIIQDNSPTSGLPAAGVNTDEFSDSIDVATPTVTLVAPTFPALAPASSTVNEVVAALGNATIPLTAVATGTSVVTNSTAAYLAVAADERQAADSKRRKARSPKAAKPDTTPVAKAKRAPHSGHKARMH